MSDSPICELIDWDSRHFGLKIGRVCRAALSSGDLVQIDHWRRAHGLDCIYLLTGIEQLETIRRRQLAGFRFTDLRVTLDRALHQTVPPVGDDAIRPFRPEDLASLQQMAGELHHDSRFHVDSRFPQERSRALFATWIEKACADPAQQVFVAELDGRIAGYLACQRVTATQGQIQLVGVDPTARNRGLGKHLVHSALNWLGPAQAGQVRVVTQGRNIAAQRLYEKCGFLTSSIGVWYHWWRDHDE